MAWFSSLFGSTEKRARRAAVRGEYREAAALYAEAGQPEEAARALCTLAQQSQDPHVREQIWYDALHWLPGESDQRREILERVGSSRLERAESRTRHSRTEQREVEETARILEEAGAFALAARAWGLIGRDKEVARCLERAGDLEGLESLLDAMQEETDERRSGRDAMRAFEMSHAVGARIEARAALEGALRELGTDPEIEALLGGLRERWIADEKVRLRIGERVVDIVGRLPMTVGRSEADMVVRGVSVSRAHIELSRTSEGFCVRDLGSSNGTLLEGLPIRDAVTLSGAAEVGLGDDVELRIEPHGDGLYIEVLRGLDRGLVCVVGGGEISLPHGAKAVVAMKEGVPELSLRGLATATLDGRKTTGPIQLLCGDIIQLGELRLEVMG